MSAHAGEGDLSMLINDVHANTATIREMLLVHRKQLKLLKALNKETKHVNTVTASRSTPSTKNTELTMEQVIDSHITLSHIFRMYLPLTCRSMMHYMACGHTSSCHFNYQNTLVRNAWQPAEHACQHMSIIMSCFMNMPISDLGCAVAEKGYARGCQAVVLCEPIPRGSRGRRSAAFPAGSRH